MAGNACIFRVTTNGQTEATVTDKIEFDPGTIPDNTAHIRESEFNLSTALGINTKPNQNFNEVQDTGVDGLEIILTGHIENAANTLAPYRAKTWLLEDKTSTTFPKGRFGLRHDKVPFFNLTPTSNSATYVRGYILEDFRFIHDGEYVGKIAFIARLRFSGDEGLPNGSGYYVW